MNKKNKKNSIILTFLILFFASLDLISKFLIVKYLSSTYDIFSFLHLRYVENIGIAFSLPVPLPLIVFLNIILIGVLLYYALKELNINKKLTIFFLALIVGGGLGNLIDRIYNGFVIDFISILKYPLFNLADIFITIGVFSMLFFYDIIKRKNKQ